MKIHSGDEAMYYQLIGAAERKLGVVWCSAGDDFLLERIYLPRRQAQLAAKIRKEFPRVNMTERKIPGDTARKIEKIFNGSKVEFDLSLFNWDNLQKFAVQVLREAYKIPRGKVISYSGLAYKSGSPKAARAVGTVMAKNPFPLIIPCHRVVRSDGSLGGFGGGAAMKQEMLSSEGVFADTSGHIPEKYFWK